MLNIIKMKKKRSKIEDGIFYLPKTNTTLLISPGYCSVTHCLKFNFPKKFAKISTI